MKKLAWVSAIMLLLLGVFTLAGCSSSNTSTNTTATTTADTGTTDTTAGTETTAPGQTTTSEEGEAQEEVKQEATVDISNFAFFPATVTISKGGKVTWTNKDSVAHTATGRNGEFDSGTLNNGQSFTQTFNDAGTFNYYCTFHPSMTGTIVVK